MLDLETIELFTWLLAGLGVIQYFRKGDEFILLLVAFFYLTGISRYNAVMSGNAEWVRVNYAIDIFEMTDELAIEALNYFFLGTAVFSIAYAIFSEKQKRYRIIDNDQVFSQFLKSKQKMIIVLFVLFLLVSGAVNGALRAMGRGAAFGGGYLFLFGFAIGGLVILMFLLFKNLPKGHFPQRILYLVLLIGAAISSYNPTSRFQFLSWVVSLFFVIIGRLNKITKGICYAIGGVVIIVWFMMAGNKRGDIGVNTNNMDLESQVEMAQKRMEVAKDQNMLDGFMMVLQVYPQYLDYGYGSEHFEILLRPIPRALWPEKPVGGYANKLHLNDKLIEEGRGTVGISQSIYGTFYGEGGVLGIWIFCVLYAAVFKYLFNSTHKYSSDMRYILYGIIFASTIPILRGGDLPGIIAFVGMSYWPVFLFVWMYRRYLKKLRRKQIAASNKQKEIAESQAVLLP